MEYRVTYLDHSDNQITTKVEANSISVTNGFMYFGWPEAPEFAIAGGRVLFVRRYFAPPDPTPVSK